MLDRSRVKILPNIEGNDHWDSMRRVSGRTVLLAEAMRQVC
jgi:hypothetical protein